ncbi:MAG: hypothetical protein HUJ56_08450, partial [Erysipelotrichaceae bacterium]|nr:hypothetical protein [Erysipelotrichaceae bacterium]
AVRRTFSGLAKLIYPNGEMSKDEAKELLDYAIEGRRRVKEQLRKMNPGEFGDVSLGYIDLETNEETIVTLPEVSKNSLVSNVVEEPGYVYALGRSVDEKIGVYHLENKLVNGTGKFNFRNVEGISSSQKGVKDSITAAFNYFIDNVHKLLDGSYEAFDYSLYFNDLQNKGASAEVSVAEVVGLFSALANKPVMPSLVICGRVVMSGSMTQIMEDISELLIAAANAGAKKVLLPENSRSKFETVKPNLYKEIDVIFYTDPLDAASKALGVD